MYTGRKYLYTYCYFLLICLFSIQNTIINPARSAITYDLGDRLGDNLAAYCHARWLSHIHNIEFVYHPFKESEKFAFSRYHRSIDSVQNVFIRRERFDQLGTKINSTDLPIKKDEGILYSVPYFPETRYDAIKDKYMHFDIDWDNEEFMKIIRSEISPINSLHRIKLPKDRISVAIHVRRGSGPDKSRYNQDTPNQGPMFFIEDFPLRFPHDSFFIEQIKRLSEILNDQPMYVHIFTDIPNTNDLIEKFSKEVAKPNIIYNSRSHQADHSAYILQDFFDMMSFDCIIRPESHYSQIASRLSRAKIIIRPEEFIWQGRNLIITKVETLVRPIPKIENLY